MTEDKKDATTVVLAGVPQYILDHAPLLHLFSRDPYQPSSIAAQLINTHPEVDFKPVSIPSPPLSLDNLDQLNSIGANGGSDVYLTSNDDITTDPKWLKGVETDANGGTGEEKTGVIVVVDKGDGIVDAFYFYFFAFNWGGVVLEKQLGALLSLSHPRVGDHVGDWEHNMIRFKNGVPKAVWLSQHSNGEAYTFSCLKKDSSGKRPILYIANGSHAIYPTPGTHDHTLPNLNLPVPFLLVDETDDGPLYDPTLTSYAYSYTTPSSTPSSTSNSLPPAGTFTAYASSASTPVPVSFLSFRGRWGDAEYPASDPRQKGKGLFGFKKYVGGPTGVLDKQLGRKEVWPENDFSKGQRIRTGLGVGGWTAKLGFLRYFGKGALKKRKGEKRVRVSGEVVG
ncbi:uncharacterized protein K460DRAFT_278395 [Cucurbitaria berberidis CBS 394.84]|uniref:Vacuolar protein sorting-associated protein 62 n=1 Tax=Cucurbitaria berberidis CBS 394.84 TaxID=1168544 RepID=A0A9P4GPC1_9PLEO|nr:uncharacterized protein K460DRAFT_278395 [Cucurbitaria berberidis CBS 394.84]KAF1848696.1 hypothetical protein K460DRAFT_278395 [Cucurbitaria berberidis CBS 394.84]